MNLKLGVVLTAGVILVSTLSGCAASKPAPEPIEVPETVTNKLEDAILLGTIDRYDVYEFHTTDQNGLEITCILSDGYMSSNGHSISCVPSPSKPE